jgi:hypothetical protein
MKYYIMFENISDFELTVVTLDTSVNVTEFIENKINKYGYRLGDFRVIKGDPLKLQAVLVPVKVLMST